MNIKLGNGLKREVDFITLHKGEEIIKRKMEEVIYNLKREIYEDFKRDYVLNKMTGREYKALTGFLPDKEMQKLRLLTLQDFKECYQERFYLKLLLENGDDFGYADEYFREIMVKVEGESS
jgi:hypothetical protein